MAVKKNKSRKFTVSKLITRSKAYAVKRGAKNIAVSTFDGSGKYGYSNKYIPNTPANRAKITSLKGKPDFYKGRYIWM